MESTKQKNYVLPIAMMFALFAMISFVTGLPQPFGAIVQNEFGASNFEATLGFFANFIAYASWVFRQVCFYRRSAIRKQH